MAAPEPQSDKIVTEIRFAHPINPPGMFYALAHAQSTCTFEDHTVAVINARTANGDFTLHGTGFALVNQRTAVTDFDDATQIEAIYVPEIEDLIKRMTGASRVIVFHKLARYEGGEALGKRQPAGNAHIDYTRESFETWVRQELGSDVAEPLLRGRWAAINVWRGITAVERRPLALADGRTVRETSMLPVPISELPGKPTPFTGVNIRHDPAQAWHYYPHMQTDEALVFTLCSTDPALTDKVAHSAINDPGSDPGAAPRASYEVRTVAFFEGSAE